MSARMVRKAMCNDGNKLCGYSIRNGAVQDASTKAPNHPPPRGRGGQANLSGMSKKRVAAMRIEKTTRRAKTRLSWSSRHRKGAAKKKRSIDIYGTISSGQ